jgi:monoamine oxidase
MVRRRIRHRIHLIRRIHRIPRMDRGGRKGERDDMTKRIAIVGAGCAGLGAATAFMEQDILDVSVVLIEANGWIGGRARTSCVPEGLPVDLGPQFIQDPAYNPWARIAEKRGYEVKRVQMGSMYRVWMGRKWKNVEFSSGIDAMNSQLQARYEVATGFRNAAILTLEAATLTVEQQEMKLSLGSSEYGPISESAEPWQYVASDQARQDKVEYEPNGYVKDGLGKMVSDYGAWLLATFGPRLKFALNRKVTHINGKKDGVSIQTSDDEMQNFDYCIVTVPCSEVSKIEFDPSLPGPRARADGFIKLGSYKKVAFRPTRFPQGDGNTIEKDCEYYIYDQETDGVWQYFRLPTDTTMLICVTAGDFARRLDDWPNDKVAESVIALLSVAYAAGNGDFTPQNGQVVTNWTHTPNIHGAYSYTRFDDALGADNPVPLEAREQIAKPHGRIHFAGEATWKEAYGTIHGAYKSGHRAATEILEAMAQTD